MSKYNTLEKRIDALEKSIQNMEKCLKTAIAQQKASTSGNTANETTESTDYESMKVSDLKALAVKRGIKPASKKADIIKQLED